MSHRTFTFDLPFELNIGETDAHTGFGPLCGTAHCEGDIEGAAVVGISLETFLRKGQRNGEVRLPPGHFLFKPIKRAFESCDHYVELMNQEVADEFVEEFYEDWQASRSLELHGRI